MNSYGIRTQCPSCGNIFEVGLRDIGPFRTPTKEEAGNLIDGLKSPHRVTYVYDKRLGINGQRIVPMHIICPECREKLDRKELDYTAHIASVEPAESGSEE